MNDIHTMQVFKAPRNIHQLSEKSIDGNDELISESALPRGAYPRVVSLEGAA